MGVENACTSSNDRKYAAVVGKALQILQMRLPLYLIKDKPLLHALPDLLHCCAERYKKTHPEVLVHLQVENTRRCCAAVARGEVNIALVGGEIPRELEHLMQVSWDQCANYHEATG